MLSASRGGIFYLYCFSFLFDFNFSTPFACYQSQGVEFFIFIGFHFYLISIVPPLLLFISLKGWKFLSLQVFIFIWFQIFHPFCFLSASGGGNFYLYWFSFFIWLRIFHPFCMLSVSRGGILFFNYLLSKFVNFFHLFLNSLLTFCVLYGFAYAFLVWCCSVWKETTEGLLYEYFIFFNTKRESCHYRW